MLNRFAGEVIKNLVVFISLRNHCDVVRDGWEKKPSYSLHTRGASSLIGLHRHSNRCNWAVEAVAGDRVSLDCLSMTLLFSPFSERWSGRMGRPFQRRAEPESWEKRGWPYRIWPYRLASFHFISLIVRKERRALEHLGVLIFIRCFVRWVVRGSSSFS